MSAVAVGFEFTLRSRKPVSLCSISEAPSTRRIIVVFSFMQELHWDVEELFPTHRLTPHRVHCARRPRWLFGLAKKFSAHASAPNSEFALRRAGGRVEHRLAAHTFAQGTL